MGSRIDSKLLERNPQTEVREGRDPLRHHIAVPEAKFVWEMQQVAQARFRQDLDQLTSQTRMAIEEEVSDPCHWSAQPKHHLRGCPACTVA